MEGSIKSRGEMAGEQGNREIVREYQENMQRDEQRK